MARKLPWYRRNPTQFFGGTVGMKWEVKCVYGVVLDLIYDANGRLADDPGRIVHYLGVGMSKQRWAAIRGELVEAGKLVVDPDGFLTNPRADRELANGSKSGVDTANESRVLDLDYEKTGPIIPQQIGPVFRGRGNGNNDLTLFEPLQTPTLPARAREESEEERESRDERKIDSASVIVQVEAIAAVLGQPRGRYWETDFRRMVDRDGLDPADILEAANAHAERGSGPIKSITSLAGLARKKRDDRNRSGNGASSRPAVILQPANDEVWIERLNGALRRGRWAKDSGPPPFSSLCAAPAPLLERFRQQWAQNGEHPLEVFDEVALEYLKWGTPGARPSDSWIAALGIEAAR